MSPTSVTSAEAQLSFQTIGNIGANDELEIKLEFKSNSAEGLILWKGDLTGRGDSLALFGKEKAFF